MSLVKPTTYGLDTKNGATLHSKKKMKLLLEIEKKECKKLKSFQKLLE